MPKQYNASEIQHLINNLNLGTSQQGAGDFTAGNIAAAQLVAPIAIPATATATQVATAFNELLTALNTYT